jgi:CRISPR-associated protein, TM1812 family
MDTTLITILGRTPKDANGYRPTRYTFSDQSRTEPLAFFGWALQQQIHPQRMVVLGTEGSMWDHLFEGDIDFEQDNPDERLALIEATEKKQVTQEQLDRLTPYLEARIGCEVNLALIPYARDEVEQVELLRRIATHVPQEGSVHLDITHGFRHLPMLILLAALYLRIARKALIEKIWYAAYDPDTQQAPVLDLSGLLQIADGLQALSSFDKDGDYGVFVPMLRQAGLPDETVTALQKAAYYENILNVTESTGQLRRAREGLESTSLQPEAEFYYRSFVIVSPGLGKPNSFKK